MSFFKRLERAFRPALKAVAPVLRTVPGVGQVVTAAETIRGIRRGTRPRNMGPGSFNTGGIVNTGYTNMSLLPALTGLGGVAGRVIRNPGVQAGIGTAVGMGVGSRLPTVEVTGRARRRRSKGITARELKSFTRVTGILNKYCKTPAPTRRRTSRSKSCR